MKNILKIFFTDLKGLIKNPFAMIIAVGICILPSLYAWFNIYSNWDPYANTGNIKIAIYSEDKGTTTADGVSKNIGQDVVEELKSNTSIGWTQVKSRYEAETGVERGDYYAAVVINSEFTNALYNGAFTDFKDNPTITYYENEKKNAVATKITDAAVDSLKKNINEKFLNVVITSLFDETNTLAGTLEEGEDKNVYDRINSLSSNLTQYSDIIDSLIKSNDALSTSMKSAQSEANEMSNSIGNSADTFNDTNKKLTETQISVKDFNNNINKSLNEIRSMIDSISKAIDDAKFSDSVEEINNQINNILKDTITTNSHIGSLKDILFELEISSINSIKNNAGNMSSIEMEKQIDLIMSIYEKPIDTMGFISKGLDDINNTVKIIVEGNVTSVTDNIKKNLNNCADIIDSINNTYSNTLVTQLNGVMDNINNALTSATNMLNTLSGAAQSIGQVFENVGTTMSTANNTLGQIKTVIDDINKRIVDFQSKYSDIDTETYINDLIGFLKGDPKEYGNYLMSPVSIDTKKVYPVKNYGSAMTPFYTVLAIWVGMTILVSIVDVNVKPRGFKNVKSYQLYFGRLLTFLLLNVIQTVIIVVGDIYLLKCQILYPDLFIIAALVTSFTFTLLIYSLTIAFGDIGKAIAVIIMVIQIAGSSGTFPIELLPTMNQNIYIFFPFPYAIDAMRETIGGLYGMTFVTSLSKLIVFAVVGLIIGLFIRIPFVGINHYMEKRMRDTKMM